MAVSTYRRLHIKKPLKCVHVCMYIYAEGVIYLFTAPYSTLRDAIHSIKLARTSS